MSFSCGPLTSTVEWVTQVLEAEDQDQGAWLYSSGHLLPISVLTQGLDIFAFFISPSQSCRMMGNIIALINLNDPFLKPISKLSHFLRYSKLGFQHIDMEGCSSAPNTSIFFSPTYMEVLGAELHLWKNREGKKSS